MSPMRVFCTSSGLRISRSCRKATRAPPGARRAMYSVSEIPSKRSLASQVVLFEEHSPAPMVDSEYGVNVCIDGAGERRCVVSCTSDCSIEEDPAVEQFLDVWRYPQMRAAGVRRLEPWQFSRVKSCLSGYVAIPCISDGTLPRCVLLGGTGQEFDGLEDFAHTCDGVGLTACQYTSCSRHIIMWTPHLLKHVCASSTRPLASHMQSHCTSAIHQHHNDVDIQEGGGGEKGRRRC